MDPISTFTTGVHSSIRILEVTYQLKTVDEQTTDLLKTTEHVNRNIEEARRLKRIKADHVNEAECSWMNSIIHDTEVALLEVARLIEPARVDTETSKSVNPRNRVLWVLRDGPKLQDKHRKLQICHQSLTTIISALHSKNMGFASAILETKQSEPPPYDPEMEAFFNWRLRKRAKSSGKVADAVPIPPIAELPSSLPTMLSGTPELTVERRSPQLALEPFSTFDPLAEVHPAMAVGEKPESDDLSFLDISFDNLSLSPSDLSADLYQSSSCMEITKKG